MREMAPRSGSHPSRRFLLRAGAAAAALPFGFAASSGHAWAPGPETPFDPGPLCRPAAAEGALDEARVRLETLSRIHWRLYDPERISRPVGQYLQEPGTDLLDATGAQNGVCRVDVPPLALDLTRLTTLSLPVVEVVTNALKHAFVPGGGGTITIRLERLDLGRLALPVADDGRGMSSGFDPGRNKSLGYRISQGLAGQLGGSLACGGTVGTVVCVEFFGS
ncbi:sensor histidine kinase [Methylobacterium sp. PvR107]|uniref:sensor histidine kinase n=1 Tax=Methylobacterium sp. PvR107 TaxID=2806597 RepID=UPI001B584529|nr:sensor histidine kinase [Methylobacterium sp. PvR107]MBP1179441.1 two-component sensor histidine kinase [Methylobacterium sp. PvR107]